METRYVIKVNKMRNFCSFSMDFWILMTFNKIFGPILCVSVCYKTLNFWFKDGNNGSIREKISSEDNWW